MSEMRAQSNCTWGVGFSGGDTREHLARSMTAWRKLSENLK